MIVVIGILAAITITAFNGVQKRAAVAALESDLKGATTQLELDKTSSPTEVYADSSAGIKASGGNKFEYTYIAADNSYCLTATTDKKGVSAYMVSSSDKTPREGACAGHMNPNTPPPQATADSCFTVSSGSGLITDYSSDASCPRDVVIPNQINGTAVTRIYSNAFKGKQLTSVAIADSVIEIGMNAFANNKLASVVIPNSVTTIKTYAFHANELASVTIPNSVTQIEAYSFKSNQLTSLTIPNSIEGIGIRAFESNQLTSVTIPDSVKSIEFEAFRGNKLTTVSLPDSMTVINERVFYNNKLTSVTIPGSITSIGANAFAYNNLRSVTIPSSIRSIGANAFRTNLLASVAVPSAATLDPSSFDANVTVTRY